MNDQDDGPGAESIVEYFSETYRSLTSFQKQGLKRIIEAQRAQGRREAAEAVRAKRLAGPDGLQMFKSNFNSGIDVAIDAILEGEGVER
jgi:hypothetical protein